MHAFFTRTARARKRTAPATALAGFAASRAVQTITTTELPSPRPPPKGCSRCLPQPRAIARPLPFLTPVRDLRAVTQGFRPVNPKLVLLPRHLGSTAGAGGYLYPGIQKATRPPQGGYLYP